VTSRNEQFEALARLFEYPGAEYVEVLRVTKDLVADRAAALADFTATAERQSLVQIQELYTATFDLNPACALDIGWHLFGEDYTRGLFLVRMRQELRKYAVSEGANLSDHVTGALRLLGRMEHDHAEEFAIACVQPALARMALPVENLFHDLLEAARQLVVAHFPGAVVQQPAVSLPVIAEGVLP
jgi:nitrate reductase assembly molybdenum cofactor insertion protein NarJ